MKEHKFNAMLGQSLQSINMLVDSSKVVGTPVKVYENRTLIPLSRISFGFGVGGSEFETKNNKIITNNLVENEDELPFGGGTLGGVNISPIAFILIDNESAQILRVEQGDTLFDKLLELFINAIKKSKQKNKE